MGGIDTSSTAFLFLLAFAALFGALIFGIAQNGMGTMGRVLGLTIVSIVLLLGAYIVSGSN